MDLSEPLLNKMADICIREKKLYDFYDGNETMLEAVRETFLDLEGHNLIFLYSANPSMDFINEIVFYIIRAMKIPDRVLWDMAQKIVKKAKLNEQVESPNLNNILNPAFDSRVLTVSAYREAYFRAAILNLAKLRSCAAGFSEDDGADYFTCSIINLIITKTTEKISFEELEEDQEKLFQKDEAYNVIEYLEKILTDYYLTMSD